MCDEIVWSLLLNALQKLYKGMSVLRGKDRGGEEDQWRAPSRSPYKQGGRPSCSRAQLSTLFTRSGPFLWWHNMKPRVAFLSALRHETWLRMTKRVTHRVDFFLKPSHALRSFFCQPVWRCSVKPWCAPKRQNALKPWAPHFWPCSAMGSDLLCAAQWPCYCWALKAKTTACPTGSCYSQWSREEAFNGFVNWMQQHYKFRDRRDDCEVSWPNF